jgi:hypothetical protein
MPITADLVKQAEERYRMAAENLGVCADKLGTAQQAHNNAVNRLKEADYALAKARGEYAKVKP